MSHTVIGLFDNRTEAQAASQELVRQGFSQESIDVSNRSTNTAAATGSSTSGSGDGISNFFNSLFGDDAATARNYTEAASDADAILTVHADSEERARLAAEILDRNGAIDVDGRASQGTAQNLSQSTTENAANVQGETAIPVIKEELAVGKREVERGGARIRSRVVEKPVEASVRLREEHVVVNRRPVNRAVTDSDLTNFKEGEIELTEHAEEAVVGKQARVVEEVSVGKNVTEREQTVRDTVRGTEVEVEEIDNDSATRTANNRS